MTFLNKKGMSEMKGPLNVAVVGAGYWGRKVITEYLQLASMNPNVKRAPLRNH